MAEGPLSPEGRLRIEVTPTIWSQDSRFGRHAEDGGLVDEVEPLGFDLTRDRFGTGVAPAFAEVEAALAGALDDPTFDLSLGTTDTRIEESRIRIPLHLDLGVTEWLSVGVTVPFVKRRTEVGLFLRADTLTANVGLSPSVASPAETDAFLQGFADALDAMEARREELCASGTASECQAAQAALDDGRAYHDGVRGAYASASLFPYQTSGAGRGLQDRLQALDAAFASLGVTGLPPSVPLAPGPLDEGSLQTLITDPAYGIGAEPLQTWESRFGLGDVELRASARLLQGAPPARERPSSRPAYLLGAGALLRLGTGTPDTPDNLVDLGTGDGQTDVELRLFGDVTLGRRFGIWTDARYGLQMEGERTRRIAAPEAVLAPASSRVPVTWTPGDYLHLEAAPRVHLTPELAVAGRYRYYHEGEDGYAFANPTVPELTALLDPGLLERETEVTLHQVGVSLVYSTLLTSARGRTGIPFEVHVQYRAALSGSGGQAPKAGILRVGTRLFWRIWGE